MNNHMKDVVGIRRNLEQDKPIYEVRTAAGVTLDMVPSIHKAVNICRDSRANSVVYEVKPSGKTQIFPEV